MVVCPLCEEAQPPAEACRVCGRALVGVGGVAAAPVEPVAGLEPTRLPDAGPAVADAVPGLEPTLLEAVPDAAPADTGWLEPTGAPEVGSVQVEPVEIERDVREAPPPRAAGAVLACRYCGEPPGPADVFCRGCGMKLERIRPGAAR